MLEKVTLYKYEMKAIQRKLDKLKALEEFGVSAWVHHDEALREWQNKVDYEELLEQAIVDINDLMTEADVDEPAGRGCGYSITFDEDSMAKILEQYSIDNRKLEARCRVL